ncbi:MAG: hypothetical protein J3Q66DRAFT_117312 [Benniella sp.]|nr:MAG: hypothetical protein J3Q66DRAFT_117312 [Benniella sp.]
MWAKERTLSRSAAHSGHGRLFRPVIATSLFLALTLVGNGLGKYATGLVSAVPVVDHLKRQDTHEPPLAQDPCAVLAKLDEPNITYSHVKRCYENIPYNETEANIVLSTMHTLFRDYFIFLDMSTTPNLPKPFTSPPVDILRGLDRISKQEYHGDFRFHTDLDILVSSLNDAHANYIPFCYRHYLYVQPFELYAPVVNGKQTVRILQDKGTSDFEECEVLTIDGIDALEAIQNYIDVHSAVSKDRGVRLNKALSQLTYDTAEKAYSLNPGLFTSRTKLPERESVNYHILCPPSETHPLERDRYINADWQVYRLVSWNDFTDTESFLTQNCYHETDPKDTKDPKLIESSSKRPMSESRRLETLQAAIDPPRHNTIRPLPAVKKRQLLENPVANLIYNGSSTAFYQLVKQPKVGVVVIPTHSVNLEVETSVMEAGFDLLSKAGVENVILDLTANGGGYVNFAYDLVDWMFPSDIKTSVYLSDLRASMSVKALAQLDLASEEYASYFNPSSFSDPATGKDYDVNFFLQDRLVKRAHRRLDYTPMVIMNHKLGAFGMDMPWQQEAQRIVVMTDGACGSACGMSLNRLKNNHGVKSYAIGGRAGEDLSLFSFPGASVYGLDALLEDFEALGVDPPLKQLRYKGVYRVPILEFFQEGETVPIEYNPKLFKADYHLDYTPITARHHEIFWEVIANNHWNQDGQTDDQ